MWTFLTICGLAYIIAEVYEQRLKIRAKADLSRGQYDELVSRMAALEQRMANLETIVLEEEKKKAFERAL